MSQVRYCLVLLFCCTIVASGMRRSENWEDSIKIESQRDVELFRYLDKAYPKDHRSPFDRLVVAEICEMIVDNKDREGTLDELAAARFALYKTGDLGDCMKKLSGVVDEALLKLREKGSQSIRDKVEEIIASRSNQ